MEEKKGCFIESERNKIPRTHNEEEGLWEFDTPRIYSKQDGQGKWVTYLTGL